MGFKMARDGFAVGFVGLRFRTGLFFFFDLAEAEWQKNVFAAERGDTSNCRGRLNRGSPQGRARFVGGQHVIRLDYSA
jgi:hypothetical protein